MIDDVTITQLARHDMRPTRWSRSSPTRGPSVRGSLPEERPTGSKPKSRELLIGAHRDLRHRRSAPADHRIGGGLRQHGTGELPAAVADRAEERPLGIGA